MSDLVATSSYLPLTQREFQEGMTITQGRRVPEDVLINEIFMRLSVKSLVRFRCVCKAWYSVIADRQFIQLHRRRFQTSVYCLSQVHNGNGNGHILIERLTEEGNYQPYYRLPLVQHHHGVISSSDLIVVSHDNGYMLSNPATQDFVSLPPGIGHEEGFYCSGFGFVPSIGKYKVVHLLIDYDNEDACQVFTVGVDSSWRLGESPPFPLSTSDHTPYVNGNLHTLSLNFKYGQGRILQFNLEKETWGVMPLPDEKCVVLETALEVREIQGLLCCATCVRQKRIDIWMLRDYENGVWTKDFVIDVSQFELYIFPLKVMLDGKILLELDYGGFYYYDPRDKSFQLVCQGRTSGPIYAESLMPILGF